MSQRSPHRPGHDQAAPSPTELFSLLDDEYALDILTSIQSEAKSARTLAEECDASRPTIYRRLNRLEDAGLIETEMTYDADGHHRTVFKTTLETVTVEMGDDGVSADISTADVREPAPPISGD